MVLASVCIERLLREMAMIQVKEVPVDSIVEKVSSAPSANWYTQ